MKKWRNVFVALAIILSNTMCFVVAYTYRGILCDIEHGGFSGPASMAFLYAVPFVVGIIVCSLLAIRCGKHQR